MQKIALCFKHILFIFALCLKTRILNTLIGGRMKRDIEETLRIWKNEEQRYPLLVRGARQVGKSYSIIKFGEKEFDNLVEVNFEQKPQYITCFDTLEPKKIIETLSVLSKSDIIPGKTLLFLDEIQECPNAISALRYFHEQMAAAWRISEEEFLKNREFIYNLKLRASYGKSGNNNIGNYTHLASIHPRSYVFDDVQQVGFNVGIANPYLTWEESNQFDVGIDLGLFNNRLFFVVDYYNRKTISMLLDNKIPAITGFNNQTVNKGSVRNTGVEFTMGGTPFSGDFKWDINMNIAFNRNEVLSLNDQDDRIITSYHEGKPTHVIEVGKPIGQFFGFVFEGLYTASDMDDPNVPKCHNAYEGASKYKDINGDGAISDVVDYTIIGDVNPNFVFGLSNSFTYKNFSLSIFLNGQQGGHVVSGLRSITTNLQGYFNVSREMTNRWVSTSEPGDGEHYGYPLLSPHLGHRMSTLWIEDASYLRISNLTLGYSLPETWMKCTGGISNVRLSFIIQNLAIFTKYKGANPEAQTLKYDNKLAPGWDMSTYPLARTASLGINVSF